MSLPRLTPRRGPPRKDSVIGVVYSHIAADKDFDGVFSIEPLIGRVVKDYQTKLKGALSVRTIHNKLAVLRKHYGVITKKVPGEYLFQLLPDEPIPDPRIELKKVVVSFLGEGAMTNDLVDAILAAGYRKVI